MRPDLEHTVVAISPSNSNQSIASSSANVPEHFYCPLSGGVMLHPVKTEHGHTFERAWIDAVIKSGKPCPLTRKPFETRKLTPDRALEKAIASHPQAAAEAQEAEAPPIVAPRRARLQRMPAMPIPRQETVEPVVDGDAFDALREAPGFHHDNAPRGWMSPRVRSVPMQPSDVISESFFLGNPAGSVHAAMSRANLMVKIAQLQRQLRRLEASNARLDDRARCAGRIFQLKTYLNFARVGAVVTTPVDLMLGTFTAPENSPHAWPRAGVLGSTLWATAPCVALTSGAIAQGASLVGAGIKVGVRLAALAPAGMANKIARYRYALRDGA